MKHAKCSRPRPLATISSRHRTSPRLSEDLENLNHPGTAKQQHLFRAASIILPSSFSGANPRPWPCHRLVQRTTALQVSYEYEKTPIRAFTSVTLITKREPDCCCISISIAMTVTTKCRVVQPITAAGDAHHVHQNWKAMDTPVPDPCTDCLLCINSPPCPIPHHPCRSPL